MLREAYLSSEYTAEDKELIALFQKQLKKLNQLFQAALLAGDRTKAVVLLKQMQAIHKSLNTEYGLRAQIRIPQEYLKGALYIDDHLNQASSLLRLKTKKNLSAFYMERITQLGPVHTEAVKALLDNSKMLVSASLSSSEKVAMNMINKYQQAQVRLKLAEWTIRGDWIEKMKKSLTQMFAKSWVDKFQDRAGRMRNVNRYVDMLTRTETKIANTQGTINRAIESGISKFEVIEQQNCCEICARYNGKIVDISKGAVELPPYHPNCRGYINIVANEEWRNKKYTEEKEIITKLISGKTKQIILREHLTPDQRKIFNQIGVNPKWYREIINHQGIKHILKNHGVNGRKVWRWEIPVRAKDLANISLITAKPDSLKLSDHKSKSWNFVIQYNKTIGNKVYDYRVRIVPQTKTVEPQTMIIKKK